MFELTKVDYETVLENEDLKNLLHLTGGRNITTEKQRKNLTLSLRFPDAHTCYRVINITKAGYMRCTHWKPGTPYPNWWYLLRAKNETYELSGRFHKTKKQIHRTYADHLRYLYEDVIGYNRLCLKLI